MSGSESHTVPQRLIDAAFPPISRCSFPCQADTCGILGAAASEGPTVASFVETASILVQGAPLGKLFV